jgi:glucosylglycerol 3-phosphatase
MAHMNNAPRSFSLDHRGLLDSLSATENLLVIQDLDGVCMGLVRDPLTRTLDRRYIEAARQMSGHFYVLTNGEHIGSRGVNGIVERALDGQRHPSEQGCYLPGLAAGGVQLQDCYGQVSHPGISDAEIAFLDALPTRFADYLRTVLSASPLHLNAATVDTLIDACVLDNLVSPTLNINACYQQLRHRPDAFTALQQQLERFMERLLSEAAACGLADSFFVHYAPNLGRNVDGSERLRPGSEHDAGTTDFQFMIKGAIKEVGVLVLLNHYYRHRIGHYPLGEQFNARQAPRDIAALLRLALDHFDPAHMPRILGVGDTVTSYSEQLDNRVTQLRGGSDRGFLELVQRLGNVFGTDNIVAYVDSSAGEVSRPGVNSQVLHRYQSHLDVDVWPALAGITDPQDPLRLGVIFPMGHSQYVDFFKSLAAQRSKHVKQGHGE